MRSIDINGDVGEGIRHQGRDVESVLMPHLSSANIACGGHAGDQDSMRRAIELALEHGAAIGAHPSYPDRSNFGRLPMQLSADALQSCLFEQITAIAKIADTFGVRLQHVKAHGALYHAVATDRRIAEVFAGVVRRLDDEWILFGLAGSVLQTVAREQGLAFAAEAFPDRAYHNDGRLVSRQDPRAMIEDAASMRERVHHLLREGQVQSVEGTWLPLQADTWCIHGDSPQAPLWGQLLRESLQRESILMGLTRPPPPPRFIPLGESALIVKAGSRVTEKIHTQVRQWLHALTAAPPAGVVELVPTYNELTIYFDPQHTGVEQLRLAIESAMLNPHAELPAPRCVEIPVCYGGENGPDLDALAARSGLTPAEVIRIHSATEYPVYMLGFSPGFCYLGGLDPRITCPRRDQPRPRVPAGSVGIAGQQTGVYASATPGGWNIIGRTSMTLFDPNADPAFALRAGDRVRFRAIGAAEFDARHE